MVRCGRLLILCPKVADSSPAVVEIIFWSPVSSEEKDSYARKEGVQVNPMFVAQF